MVANYQGLNTTIVVAAVWLRLMERRYEGTSTLGSGFVLPVGLDKLATGGFMFSALKAQAARALGHAVRVRSIVELSPNLRWITLEGPSLAEVSFEPGMKVKLGVNGVLRSYTPARMDPHSGQVEIVFHLHGLGPAAIWAARASVGDGASVLGPGRSLSRAPDAPWAMFFGDETTLGLARAFSQDRDAAMVGAIELAAVDHPAVEGLELPLGAVERGATYGASLLEVAERMEVPEGEGVIWISGHAGSVRAVWEHFLERGVPRSQLRVKPYWSERGSAHRKSVARQLS